MSASLLSVQLGVGTLSSSTVSASTHGGGGATTSEASVHDVVAFQGQPAQVTATVIAAHAEANCGGVHGSSTIANLTFGGLQVTATGAPNQTLVIPGVATPILNEQVVAPNFPEITVNALHLILGTGEEVVLSSAQSGVDCLLPVERTAWAEVKMLYR